MESTLHNHNHPLVSHSVRGTVPGYKVFSIGISGYPGSSILEQCSPVFASAAQQEGPWTMLVLGATVLVSGVWWFIDGKLRQWSAHGYFDVGYNKSIGGARRMDSGYAGDVIHYTCSFHSFATLWCYGRRGLSFHGIVDFEKITNGWLTPTHTLIW
jgi:hypothetical protein